MKINLNDRVAFTLTEAGAKLWNAQFDMCPPEWRPDPVPAGAEVKTQLWTFVQVFGPHTYMGMPSAHVEGNNMEIESAV